MLMESRNHAGRTPSEQAEHERRCTQWERQEAYRREVVRRQTEADAAARMWGEW
jgi:hypothetical protein